MPQVVSPHPYCPRLFLPSLRLYLPTLIPSGCITSPWLPQVVFFQPYCPRLISTPLLWQVVSPHPYYTRLYLLTPIAPGCTSPHLLPQVVSLHPYCLKLYLPSPIAPGCTSPTLSPLLYFRTLPNRVSFFQVVPPQPCPPCCISVHFQTGFHSFRLYLPNPIPPVVSPYTSKQAFILSGCTSPPLLLQVVSSQPHPPCCISLHFPAGFHFFRLLPSHPYCIRFIFPPLPTVMSSNQLRRTRTKDTSPQRAQFCACRKWTLPPRNCCTACNKANTMMQLTHTFLSKIPLCDKPVLAANQSIHILPTKHVTKAVKDKAELHHLEAKMMKENGMMYCFCIFSLT